MLTKILFTVVVIIGVSLFFRNKQTDSKPHKKLEPEPDADTGSISTRTVAYLLIGVLVCISMLVFVINWNAQNKIVNIKVISAAGITTQYQARHKSIEGRSFVTLEGLSISLGENDRIEMNEN